MFEHAGAKPLWPVILFLPLFLVGVAVLRQGALARIAERRRPKRPGAAAADRSERR